MLLGIALHASMSYIGLPMWVGQEPPSEALKTFFWAVHGFRMPLFFLLSGFFTAMLFTRRGLGGLLRHRAKRIGLPLLIGSFTIVPLTWAVLIGGIVLSAASPQPPADEGAPTDLWSAAKAGDVEALRYYAAEEIADLDRGDPTMKTLPLSWAAAHGHDEAVALLLESGADPNAHNGDQSTPLHTAAFFGRAEAVRLMLDAGALPDAKTASGEVPAASARHNEGTTNFIAGILGVEIDFAEVAQGREAVLEMLADLATPEPEPTLGEKIVEGLFAFPVFNHLWFLWFLCWLIAGFAVVVLIGQYLPRIALPRALIATPLCLLVLVPLTMLTHVFMDSGNTLPMFGPDTSAGILPIPRVLAYYAVFFGFGAVLYSLPGAIDRVAKGWWLWLALAAAIYVPASSLAMSGTLAASLTTDEPTRRLLANIGQALFAWFMVLAMIGMFEALLSRERRWVRYLSDASYWLYLTHLPIIMLGQMALARVNLPMWIEFPALVIIPTLGLLGCYHLFVRYTFIGTILNGPRQRPSRVANA